MLCSALPLLFFILLGKTGLYRTQHPLRALPKSPYYQGYFALQDTKKLIFFEKMHTNRIMGSRRTIWT